MKSRGGPTSIELQLGAEYSFGPFRLDVRKRRVWRGDRPLALTPKAFDTLLELVRQAGQTVDKDDLLKTVWPGTFVSEETLTQNIATIRRALGDSSDCPQYIATVPRRGYRFISALTAEPAIGTPRIAKSDLSIKAGVPRLHKLVLGGLLTCAVLVLSAFGVMRFLRLGTPDRVSPILVHAPTGETLTGSFALSPSGKRLVFITSGMTPEQSLMWLRSVDGVTAQRLAGTDGAAMPFWSPDERAVGFFAHRRLKTIQLDSGRVTTIAEVGRARGGTWSPEGLILFAPDIGSPILSVASTGGTPAPVTELGDRPDHRFPCFLPDGQHFVFLVLNEDRDQSEVRWARVGGPETGVLLTASSAAVYFSEGYILFARAGSLLAQRFDVSRLRLIGAPVVIRETVGVYGEDGPTGLGLFSGGGKSVAMMDLPGPAQQLSWFDRGGRRLGATGPAGDYMHPDLSPDGTRAALTRVDPRKRVSDIVVIDLAAGLVTQLTDDPQPDADPLWSPRGDQVAFGSVRNGRWRGFVRDAARAFEKPLSDACVAPSAWFPDTRSMLCATLGTSTSLMKVEIDGDASPTPIVAGIGFAEARISPDGSWLAFSSDHEGSRHLYVSNLERLHSKPIALGLGSSPRWRSDGHELFFLSGQDVASVSVNGGDGAFGSRQMLFKAPVYLPDSLRDTTPSLNVSPDGSRFLLLTLAGSESPTTIQILSPWSATIPK